jgi:hypothetical protein
MPLADDDLLETGTTLDYKTAFLQRLANPLQPYDPMFNPYVTVDWIPIDLTVFNGEDRQPAAWNSAADGDWDPDDTDPFGGGKPSEMFDTRERNGADRNLWLQMTEPPAITAGSPASDYFPYDLKNSLGYLNVPFEPRLTAPAGALSEYVGDPEIRSMPEPLQPWDQQTFPWLTWNNRPFATPYELMLVPTTSQGRLLHEYTTNSGKDPYQAGTDEPYNFRAPFGHLLNFLHTNNDEKAGHFYRIFDYVETPSLFVGTEGWYNAASSNHFGDSTKTAADGFRPPYNKLSQFREPSGPNINTIFDEKIFEGVMKGFPDWDPSQDGGAFWTKMQLSRQGFGTAVISSHDQTNPDVPAITANPFRSAAGADLMPDLPSMRLKYPVEATFLRSYPPDPSKAPGPTPLFEYASTDPHNNGNRNPYFRYQGLMRLGNLFTTHSNVFAVWITVGFFEVEDNKGGIDAEHPDGYRLAQEVGLDSGEVKRHRAFYIIDRSIPVAYQSGVNHNVDRAVLLRRFIE